MKQGKSRVIAKGLFGFSFLVLAHSASAETIRVPDHSPSSNPDFLTIQSIALGAFEGEDGSAFGHMVESRLSGLRGEDGPFFNVVVNGPNAKADAIVTGSARASVETFRNWQKREICDEKDADKNCLRYRDVPMDCTRRIVSVSAQLRIHAVADGRVLHSDGAQQRQEKIICPDDSSGPRTVDEVVDELLKATQFALLPELAPRLGGSNIKLREETGGLPKTSIKRFKDAVKLTKTNVAAACAEFDALANAGPQNTALAYNRGLCAETRADEAGALSIYESLRVQNGSDQSASSGIARIEKNRRVMAQIAARRAWINGRSK